MNLSDSSSFLVVAVLFVASFIRSAFGFGEALVAVPLLALVIPVSVAAPVAVLLSITIAALIVLQDWRHIHFRSAASLFLATVAGTPLGLSILTMVKESVVKALLACIIIVFSAYLLNSGKQPTLKSNRLAWLFGFGAGILGGAYGMNGPPLIVYGTLKRWPPQHFRATLQGYFLPASTLVMSGYWATGLWTADVTHLYWMSLPGALSAILLGRMANQRMKEGPFIRYMHLGLIVIGAVLLTQSLA
jgi:uncharacterized membrane protein YfcA